ncbi:MAG: hypothetical protein HY713_14630 [candidate division NC10 bacterium]|nr:hypothetical protein [candidate division NC10 bacterium]
MPAFERKHLLAARLPGVVLLVAVLLMGCADLKALLAPTPPPPSAPPVKKAPATPLPVLSPQVGREDEDRLKREASSRIQRAEQIVQQVDQGKLVKEQQETFSTIQSFLAKAKEALSTQDFQRAFNLSDKAQVLAEELVRNLR